MLGLPAFAQSGSQVQIRLGFHRYSIRSLKWKALQLLDYAAGLRLDTLQMSGSDDYESTNPTYLKTVRERAARLGIKIDAGMGSLLPKGIATTTARSENLIQGLIIAKAVGATSMRCFMAGTRLPPSELEQAIASVIEVFRALDRRRSTLVLRSPSRITRTCRRAKSE